MRLHTRVYGDGRKTAVLVHGGMVDGRLWSAVGSRLAEDLGYTVIAPDLRGHGLSPRGEYSIEAWAADLVESVPAGADVVIGHSLGATVLSLAVEQLCPARAVYAEPGFEHDVKPPEYFAERRNQLQTASVSDLRAAEPRWGSEATASFVEAMALCDPNVLDAIAGLSRSHANYVPERASVPSLLMIAGSQSVVRPETAELLAGRGFDVAVVEGAGHNVHLDDINAFFTALRGWI